MGKNEIENKIKNRISGFNEDIDTDLIWENLEPNLPRDKKKKVGFFWLFGVGALLIILVGINRNKLYVNVNQISTEKQVTSNSNVLPKIKNQSIKNSENINKKIEVSIEQNISNNKPLGSNRNIDNKIETSESKKVKNNNAKIEQSREQHALNENSLNKKRNLSNINTSQSQLLEQQANLIQEKVNLNIENDVVELTSKTQSNIVKKSETNLEKATLLLSDLKTSQPHYKQQNEPIQNLNLPSANYPDRPNHYPSISQKLESISSLVNEKLNYNPMFYPLPKLLAVDNIQKIKSMMLSFELSGGLAKSFSKMDAVSPNGETISYLNERSNTVKILETFDANLLAKITWRNGFTLKSGISYLQINEQFKNTITESNIEDRENDIVATTLFANGNVENSLGVVSYLLERQVDQYFFTTYKFINVPIVLGYQIQKGRYLFDTNIAGHLNINFKQKGQQEVFNVGVIANPEIYKSSMVLSASAELGIGYQINQHLNIWSRVNYFTTLNSTTLSSYNINQKFNAIGGKLALEVKF